MSHETITIQMSRPLYQQWQRLKADGRFDTDQEFIQACFMAWDRSRNRYQEPAVPADLRYMQRPGLSPDDYDT
jgi:hypothetical protein